MSWTDAIAATCWSLVVVVWVVGALYNVRKAPPVESKSRNGVFPFGLLIVVILVLAPIHWVSLSFGSPTVRAIGAVILIAATAFTIWSRVVLGTMWSVAPIARADHELRTTGPYAVTRHPIYTGLIGMVLGTALVSGQGSGLFILIGVVVGLAGKSQREERVMASALPEDYAEYRQRVPRLVPRPWRHPAAKTTSRYPDGPPEGGFHRR